MFIKLPFFNHKTNQTNCNMISRYLSRAHQARHTLQRHLASTATTSSSSTTLTPNSSTTNTINSTTNRSTGADVAPHSDFRQVSHTLGRLRQRLEKTSSLVSTSPSDARCLLNKRRKAMELLLTVDRAWSNTVSTNSSDLLSPEAVSRRLRSSMSVIHEASKVLPPAKIVSFLHERGDLIPLLRGSLGQHV